MQIFKQRIPSDVIARECGRPSIPETAAIEPRSRGVLGPPFSRGMTTGRNSAISRRHAPEVCKNFSRLQKREGAGNAGCSMAPVASRAIMKQSTQAYSPQVHRIIPAFPARWCYGYSVISLVYRAC
jgi:hypothetical protein